jgi:uncharacterized BrkB/YihY/UPF0761 family membrane protein
MVPARRILASLDPIHAVRVALTVMGKALTRLWGRDVMLYVGGVSFFSLLAVFPGLALAIGLYGLFLSPERAAETAQRDRELWEGKSPHGEKVAVAVGAHGFNADGADDAAGG